jgi:NAD(P)-dependent dehydrogenase (short-subunit alcohol dehydrogenase family)
MKLKNKVALITGSGSGIGKAIAIGFANEGADIVLNDVNSDVLLPVANVIKTLGRKCEALAGDVSNNDSVIKMVDAAIKKFGHIDILVNSAGITSRTPAIELTPDIWKKVIDINLTGSFFCALAVGKHMIARRQGNIINISSMAGIAAIPNDLPYVASKHGVIGLTRGLAIEWAQHNVRVNCLCPGLTVTPMVEAMQAKEPALLAERAERIPMGRPSTVEDQARAAVFFASDDSSYITGHIMPVDGGMSALFSGYSVPRKK